jgi:hypothetical protein
MSSVLKYLKDKINEDKIAFLGEDIKRLEKQREKAINGGFSKEKIADIERRLNNCVANQNHYKERLGQQEC